MALSTKVEVHNLNDYDYTEYFRGREVTIPAKGWIDMENDEAVLFLGSFNSPKLGADGQLLPEGYKKLRIVKDGSAKKSIEKEAKKAELKCQACGFMAKDAQMLHIHAKEEHSGIFEDIDAVKEADKKKKK